MSFNWNLSSSSEGEEEDFTQWQDVSTPKLDADLGDHSQAAAAAAFLPDSENDNEKDDDDEEEEVDWEDAAVPESQDPDSSAKLLQPVTIHFHNNNSAAAAASTTPTLDREQDTKRSRRRKKFRLESLPHHMQSLLWNLHRTHLLAMASRAVALSKTGSDPELLAVAHSLIPPQQQQEQQLLGAQVVTPTLSQLRDFCAWYCDWVHNVTQRREQQAQANRAAGAPAARYSRRRRLSSSVASSPAADVTNNMSSYYGSSSIPFHSHLLMYAAYLSPTYDDDPQLLWLDQQEQGSSFPFRQPQQLDILVLFLAMTRSLGWRTRWVQAIEPVSLDLTVNHPLLVAGTAPVLSNIILSESEQESPSKKRKIRLSTNEKQPSDDNHHLVANQGMQDSTASLGNSGEMSWIEIWCRESSSSSSRRRWVHVDPIHQLVNQPQQVEHIWTQQQRQQLTADDSGRCRGKQAIAYVVAVEHAACSSLLEGVSSSPSMTGATATAARSMRLTDVTPRYAASMIASLRKRGMIRGKNTNTSSNSNNDWWSGTLRSVNQYYSNRHYYQRQQQQQHFNGGASSETAICLDDNDDSDGDKKPAAVVTKATSSTHEHGDHDAMTMLDDHDDEEDEEEQELQISARKEAIPTSKAGFQNHPLYILPSLLGVTQVVAPEANQRMCGVFKGELVLLRQYVSTARPARKWPYHGRQVRDGEKPIKRVKARKKAVSSSSAFCPLQSYVDEGIASSSNDMDKEEEEDDGMQDLFAVWQTEPWSPTPVGPNDPIPVNQFRNVELELLNPGLVHMDIRGAAAVAKQLAIPYVPCLVGFEGNGGNRTPTIRGIVVHEHNQEIIREAMDEVTNWEIATEEESRRKAVLQKWKRLMVGLLTKDRIEREYGGDDDET